MTGAVGRGRGWAGIAGLIWLIATGCGQPGTEVDLSGQDVPMTFLHTTDSHSKILPFVFTPNRFDEAAGILPCKGNSQLGTCQDCLDRQDESALDPFDCGMSAPCAQFLDAERLHSERTGRAALCPVCDDAEAATDCARCLLDVKVSPRCENYTFGGAARAAYILRRERKKAVRVAHVDSGDYFQGAPIFNLFSGEPEVRVLSSMGVDVATIGNHEFDGGAKRLSDVLYLFGGITLLNANYMFEAAEDPGSTALGGQLHPFVVRNYNGLRVGYIGMGNLHSMNSLGDADNSLGIRALDMEQTLTTYVRMVEPTVDLVVLVSHMGVKADVEAAERVSGIDLIFGGHDHVVLNPPLEVRNPEGETTLVVHSGVNYKCVGRLDVLAREGRIVAHTYTIFPVVSHDEETGTPEIGEDPDVANLLYDYEIEMNRAQNLDRVLGVALGPLPRNDVGDSPLGNLVADAMRARRRVETDFSITNTLGIRADLERGDITVGKVYEIFPFENTLVTMYMSGPELKRLFDFAAARTASYGCKPQVQISGARVVLDCTRMAARYLEIGGNVVIDDYTLVAPNAIFSMAANDYIANGGSGFDMLELNTTKVNTMISLRDVVMDYIELAGELSPVIDGRIGLVQ